MNASVPEFLKGEINMPAMFQKIDKIKPAYDFVYKVAMFICKVLLIVDILITTMAVAGGGTYRLYRTRPGVKKWF